MDGWMRMSGRADLLSSTDWTRIGTAGSRRTNTIIAAENGSGAGGSMPGTGIGMASFRLTNGNRTPRCSVVWIATAMARWTGTNTARARSAMTGLTAGETISSLGIHDRSE